MGITSILIIIRRYLLAIRPITPRKIFWLYVFFTLVGIAISLGELQIPLTDLKFGFLEAIISVPLYVYIYGLLGALAYIFTSLLDEWGRWEERRESLKKELEDELKKNSANVGKVENLKEMLKKYDEKKFEDKLKEFGIERKGLRILATLPVCAGVYLLFALLIAPPQSFGLPSNASIVNATVSDIVKLIESQEKTGAAKTLIAGVCFLTGLYIKTILTAMGSLANRLTGRPPE